MSNVLYNCVSDDASGQIWASAYHGEVDHRDLFIVLLRLDVYIDGFLYDGQHNKASRMWARLALANTATACRFRVSKGHLRGPAHLEGRTLTAGCMSATASRTLTTALAGANISLARPFSAED